MFIFIKNVRDAFIARENQAKVAKTLADCDRDVQVRLPIELRLWKSLNASKLVPGAVNAGFIYGSYVPEDFVAINGTRARL